MPRVTREFHCSNCSIDFDVRLNTELNGNHRVHCPGCGHLHYRKIVDGVITTIRFNENPNDPLADDLWPMKSAIKSKSTDTAKDSYFAEDDGSGFMKRLWDEKFSGVR